MNANHWQHIPFTKAAKVVSDGGKRVKQRDYLSTGKVPVIDQGQDFIGGYVNDESMLFMGDLPVIIFGDHTRNIKFINRSFAVGAEGVKILKPDSSFEPKFFYYFLHSIDIPSRGYSRHFQFLRKFNVPLAPLDQQKSIVAEIEKQFSRLDEAVAALKRIQANLRRYKASVLRAAVEGKLSEQWRKEHLDVEPASELLKRILVERRKKWEEDYIKKYVVAYGHAPKDDSWKKKYKEPVAPDTSNLPQLPKGWVWATADQLFSFVTSGSRGWARYYSDSGPLFLRMGNLDHDTINLNLSNMQFVQPPEGAEGMRTRVMEGDILVSITADVGMIGLVPHGFEEAYINQHIALARTANSVNYIYLAWFFASQDGQDQLKNLQRGATKVGLGLEDIKAVHVPLPSLAEQQVIISEIIQLFDY